jgi:hypothetical protein
MTTSPRVIGVELRHRFDPPQRVALVFRIQPSNRSSDTTAHLLGARVGYDEAQFSQAASASALTH